MTQPGDAAILARLDFAPKCPIVEQHPDCAHPDIPCRRPAAITMRIHACGQTQPNTLIACERHAAGIAVTGITTMLRRIGANNGRCPECGKQFTTTDQPFEWAEL